MRTLEVQGGASSSGLVNIATIILVATLIFKLPRYNIHNNYSFRLVSALLFFSLPSLILNDLSKMVEVLIKVLTILSVAYLAYLAFFKSSKSIEKMIDLMFLLGILSGVAYTITSGANFDANRAVGERFSFLIFEYPHSAGMFYSSLVPAYIHLTKSKTKLDRLFRYSVIGVVMPLVIYYSGARVAIICYIFSISAYYLLSSGFKAKLVYLVIASILAVYINNVNNDAVSTVAEIDKNSIQNYIDDDRSYSENSIHTRVKVWYVMWDQTVNGKVLYGNGYKSWSEKYMSYHKLASSQSDYFTYFFELGIFGLLWLVMYKVHLLFLNYKDIVRSSLLGCLTVGICVTSIFGGMTENFEGYASTSWLIPMLIGATWAKIKKEKESNERSVY
ncbi:O-antigen ligase family protein [Vibrio variabilis]|uniref:O-antigen ligase family protein n=1 Tax=Vibrio variabilis TaxID=990271 RepID=UPI000DDB9A9A|nr:O-antigen ligase family protein [Vibrio variabilis]